MPHLPVCSTEVGGPVVHEPSPPREQVRAGVGRLDDLAQMVRLLGRPVAETGTEPVRDDRNAALFEQQAQLLEIQPPAAPAGEHERAVAERPGDGKDRQRAPAQRHPVGWVVVAQAHRDGPLQHGVDPLLDGLGDDRLGVPVSWFSVTVYPNLPGNDKHPDFEASSNGYRILVEATIVAPDNDPFAPSDYERDVQEKFSQLEIANFRVQIPRVSGTLKRCLKKKEIKREFGRHDVLFGKDGSWNGSRSGLAAVLFFSNTASYAVPSTEARLFVNPTLSPDELPAALRRLPHIHGPDGSECKGGESVPSIPGARLRKKETANGESTS